jgi:hypothetical protein
MWLDGSLLSTTLPHVKGGFPRSAAEALSGQLTCCGRRVGAPTAIMLHLKIIDEPRVTQTGGREDNQRYRLPWGA